MKTVVVTGSRMWKEWKKIYHALDLSEPELVVHGGAQGADSYAHAWAKKHGCVSMVYFPNYDRHGKGAPLVRNKRMLLDHPSAQVLGFPLENSRGTLFTLREAEKLGMSVSNLGTVFELEIEACDLRINPPVQVTISQHASQHASDGETENKNTQPTKAE